MQSSLSGFYDDFSGLLRQHRLDAQRHQLQLAVEVGVDHSVVSRWENGHAYPTLAQLYEVGVALGLDEAQTIGLFMAWTRETGRMPLRFIPARERPEAMAEFLDESIDCARHLRKAGQPRKALSLSRRDAVLALDHVQKFPRSALHAHLLTKVSELLLEECKAALDFMPRAEVKSGALGAVLTNMWLISAECRTAESRFLFDLATEGVTYVGGDAELAFRQTIELVNLGSSIPAPWRSEVLRAAAINAGRGGERDILLSIQLLIDNLLKTGDLPNGEKAFLLEGLGRSWATIEPARGLDIIEQAWSFRDHAPESEGRSLLRSVQLTRSEAEVVAAHRGVKNDGNIVLKIENAINVSRVHGYDRYVHQLNRWLQKVA